MSNRKRAFGGGGAGVGWELHEELLTQDTSEVMCDPRSVEGEGCEALWRVDKRGRELCPQFSRPGCLRTGPTCYDQLWVSLAELLYGSGTEIFN